MKEKIYSIPVNDAFRSECECPVCRMYKTLEDDAVAYTMGPSYMEDDTRAMTDEKGFCRRHMQMIYDSGNKLGIALILKTHFDKVIGDVKGMPAGGGRKQGLFSKKPQEDIPAAGYLERLNCSCFVCSRIDDVFDRYINTIFYLWKNEKDFRELFASARGFCNAHYARLLKDAPEFLSGRQLEEFNQVLTELYLSGMERVRDDLEWFINKFDYRYSDEPWKNSRDAIPRAMTKTNGIIMEDKQLE